MGLMRNHHSRREIAQTGSNFRTHQAEFPFDLLPRASDSVSTAVIHVWAQPFLLSLGISPAGPGDCALHQAAAGELLVLRDFLSRTPPPPPLPSPASFSCPRTPLRILS